MCSISNVRSWPKGAVREAVSVLQSLSERNFLGSSQRPGERPLPTYCSPSGYLRPTVASPRYTARARIELSGYAAFAGPFSTENAARYSTGPEVLPLKVGGAFAVARRADFLPEPDTSAQ